MLLRVFERLFVIVLLLNSMGLVTALTNPANSGPKIVSANLHMPSVVIDAGMNLCGAVLVLRRWRRVLSAAQKVWPLVALAALVALSTAWSVDPVLTLRRSALFVVSVVLAIYLGERYSIDRFARLLAQALCLMILLVIVFRVVAPAYVLDEWGAWRGLSAYKNAFGEYMAECVTLLLLVRFRQFRWLRYAFLFAAAVLLMLSHSAGALSCCVLVVAAMPLWRLTRLNRARRLSLFAVIALAAVPGVNYISDNAGMLFQALGRDSTLTGRTHLWSLLLSAIAKHPILGYGYGAFWTGLKGEALNVWIGSGWLPQAADNGYLDLCISLGLVGVCAFVALWLRCFLQGKTYVSSEQAPIGLWPVTFLCFFLIHNVCESTLTGGSFPFLVFTVLATSLAVHHQDAVIATRVTDRRPLVQEWEPRALAG